MTAPFAAKADPVLPLFEAANFASPEPNAYFPMVAGLTSVLTGTIRDADGSVQPFSLKRTIVGPGPIILGVQTTSIRDDESEGGLITESSLDYYANAASGAVWYFGEDVTAFTYDDAGVLTDTKRAPSWTAGVEGARPGIVIEAAPVLAKVMFRAFAPKAGETEFSVIEGLGDVVTIYTESSADPDLRERSQYAKGVGLIKTEEDLAAGKTNPAVSAALQPWTGQG